MKKIKYCTQCGESVNEELIEDNQVKCKSCTSILDAYTGEVLSRPVIIPDYEPGDYPEGFNAELHNL